DMGQQRFSIEGAAQDPSIERSPLGQFGLRKSNNNGGSIKVIRLPDQSVLGQFRDEGFKRHRFSGDDRWLAMWSDEALQVLNLTRADIALNLRLADIGNVDFLAHNSILSVDFSSASMLIPLDNTLMERFARWLAPRPLTAEERCLYGFGGQSCSKAIVPRAQTAHPERTEK